MDFASSAAKAIVGGLIAGLGALASVMVGDVGFGDVTDGQWVAVAATALVAFAGVWGVPNKPPAE